MFRRKLPGFKTNKYRVRNSPVERLLDFLKRVATQRVFGVSSEFIVPTPTPMVDRAIRAAFF